MFAHHRNLETLTALVYRKLACAELQEAIEAPSESQQLRELLSSLSATANRRDPLWDFITVTV